MRGRKETLEMSWNNKRESYIDISFNSELGGVVAYVVDTEKINLYNWLEDHGYKELYSKLKTNYKRVSIIKNIEVNGWSRGHGIGDNFLSEVITASELSGAEAIVLVADMDECNEFDLVRWYEDWDFEVCSKVGGNPLMIRYA